MFTQYTQILFNKNKVKNIKNMPQKKNILRPK